ncbi:protein CURVATURE THYLAKOID 1D, chloroplastic-like [Phragmites australis]|uniref:protein CURVATURE THYLAKOID 1D, chloroplastic-like n=1 Tax=Phragmites australis TaxID=29695 RepID=UPI002D76B9D5|nr:protein CURVATURE THYLAKOID 1D, chloroplastic-like [Phragmites australis]
MQLFVCTTASTARATAPLSFAPLRRGGSASSVVLPRRRRLPARGWRCASAAVPDPVPSEEPASASSTVVVTDKPDSPADEKGGDVSAASSGSVESAVAAPVSSGASEEDGGLDDILSKLDIEVTPALILTGSGAFIALWILSSVVSAIDSVPLLPKLLELVGVGYSIWFTTRYLLFKESRDELFAKFEDLKQRII